MRGVRNSNNLISIGGRLSTYTLIYGIPIVLEFVNLQTA